MVFRICDQYYPYPEKVVSSEEALRHELVHLLRKTPGRAVQLVSARGDILDITLDQRIASVQFTNHTMQPPYLMPINEEAPSDKYHEFDVGGTPTPVSLRHCIKPEKALEIAVYFFHHGTIPNDVQWEEV